MKKNLSNRGMSVPTWAQTLEDNYVTIDREGSLISNLILPSNFPGFSGSTLLKANQYVKYLNYFYLFIYLDFDSGFKTTRVSKR